ncbi:MAG: hypothetical protein P4L85_01400 [Paludisphaera borealis]|uniref:hypothetical protein n=1 Tax=Paludisphaera borealis TaxID=1387353 RepID=UPI00283E7663|nr:hypothetical protein [Paludisphaera borealis]MDR3617975.1 hypothetical protein [Paludisphaera borealis]
MGVLEAILGQVDAAATELAGYEPSCMNWLERACTVARWVVPALDACAEELTQYAEDVLNAPAKLRRMWTELKQCTDAPTSSIQAFERLLSLDDVLRESVTGEVVSKVVTGFLMDRHLEFRSNGRSDYPDLFLNTLDYTGLAAFARKGVGPMQYGAALKGKERRPVRVPDGLEIKTCRKAIRVDCHNCHVGLHLILVFAEEKRLFRVTDLALGFLKAADYRESGRNTTTTTVKFSFNGDRFHSLMHR